MVDIVLFHSALGLRPAVREFAEMLQEDGHRVSTPDLYAGAVFDDLDAGVAERDRIGVPELVQRAGEAVEQLPDELLYAGFSMGAMPAQLFAGTRPGAVGACLLQGGAVPVDVGVARWPTSVPVQLHVADEDAWFDLGDALQIEDAMPDGLVDLHVYPGNGHLFMDEYGPDHDPEASQLLLEAVRTWLSAL